MIYRFLLMCVVTAVTSLFFFPFSLKALPAVNTKMALAAMGLVLFLCRMGKSRAGVWNRDMFILSIIAAMVSLAGVVSVTLNETPDYAYATYLVSMWVWLGGAYMVDSCIRWVHGRNSVWLICNYLAAVCVFQCVMALWIDSSVAVKTAVDSVIEQGQFFLDKVDRLYGIGAALDVAGSRFAAVLVMLAFCMTSLHHTKYSRWLPLYLLAFIWIGVVGNMVARTTSIGLLLGVAYMVYKSDIWRLRLSEAFRSLWLWLGGILLLAIPLCVFLYQHDADFHKQIRFAFEGFFSLAEKGSWDVSSNAKLKTMYVFPDNWKTWLIGDGYFSNPVYTDPYFTGKVIEGYYMGTDVGYLRFIFYFGIIGLAFFSALFCKAAAICWKRFTAQRLLFGMLLMVHFIVWFKVSTDIFLVFALFLMVNSEENDAYNAEIVREEE